MTRPVPQALVFAVSLLEFALTAAAGAGADATAESKPPRLDFHGDPLPEGVVARLGTLRFLHLGGIAAVAISADGKVVASGGSDGKEVYLSKKVLQKGDGITLYTGDRVTQSTIRLWDAGTGKLIREITTPDAPVLCLYFDPAGRTLFAGCGRYLCSWEISTGKKVWQEEGVKGGRFHEGICTEKILLAKDRLISFHSGVLLCDQGTPCFYHRQKAVRFWDSTTGKPLLTPLALRSTLRAEALIPMLFHETAVSPDGRYAAVLTSQAKPSPSKQEVGAPFVFVFGGEWTYTDRRLQVIDLHTAKVSHTFPDDQGAIKDLLFSDDGRTLAVAAGKEIRLIRTEDGQTRLLAKNLPWVTSLRFVGQQKHLAALLGDETIRVWDIATGQRIEPHAIPTQSFWTENNGRVVVSKHGNTVRLTDLLSGKEIPSFAGHRLTPLVRFALLSRDTLLSRDAERAYHPNVERAYSWDARSWKVKDVLVIPALPFPIKAMLRGGPQAMDQDASVERRLYAREHEKRLELRDLKTDRLVRVLEGGVAERSDVPLFSATGDRLVTQVDKCFQFFDVDTGKSLSQLPATDNRLSAFNRNKWSPRGHYFAQQQELDRVEVFQVNPGKLLRIFSPQPEGRTGKDGSLRRLDFSGDEEVLLGEFHEPLPYPHMGFRDQRITVLLWDVNTGQAIQEIVIRPRFIESSRIFGAPSQLNALTLSNDHRLLALVEKGSKTVEIWETASGTKRGELAGHDGAVVDLSFSRDDRQLASSSEDTTILIWDMNRPLQPAKFKDRLGAEELAAHWQTLSQPDAMRADTAIWSMVYAASDSVAFLKKHLRAVVRPDGKRLQQLLAALDADDFKRRAKAEAEIEGLGELALGELEAALKQPNTLEKERRLETLRRKALKAALPFRTAERLRQWRTLEALERMGTPAAEQFLRELADGAPGARLTVAARAAVARRESLAKPERMTKPE